MSSDDASVEAWKEHASAFDRVQSVASTVSAPRSASAIASEASVAENTARDHLERLVEMNVLLKDEDGGTTVYGPDPLHTRMQTLRELLDTHDHDDLLELKADLQERIRQWREEFGVDTPERLREQAAQADDAATTREIRQTANDWELVAYRLGVVEDAIQNYSTYNRDTPASA